MMLNPIKFKRVISDGRYYDEQELEFDFSHGKIDIEVSNSDKTMYFSLDNDNTQKLLKWIQEVQWIKNLTKGLNTID